MASLIVNPSSYTITAINQNTITINYECDVTLTDVKLSTNGGSTFIDNTMMGTNVATFNVGNLVNNTYDCVLKGFYEEENTTPTEIPVQSITSSVNNSSLKVGETTQINTIFTPSNASNKTLTYRSNNTSIATVDEYGMITAIKEGTTQIIVSSNNNKTSTVSINVIADSSGGAGGGTSSDITIAQSSYTIQAGQDLKVSYTSSIALSSCMLLFGPNYTDNDYVGGYISTPGEFTFYTGSKAPGNYTVKVKGRVWNDFTSSYDDYYSNEFTLVINASSGGEGGETITPITIGNIDDMNVTSGSTFNITYTTNVEAVKHEMSFDGGSTFHVIYPTGDKNGYSYQHEALTETASPYQRIVRVTDANGNVATSNIFSITVSLDNTGGTQPSPSYDITIAQSSYTIQAGQDIKVNYTSSKTLSTCMLLYGPDFSETDGYSGGYISASNEFTFYTSSKPTGTYTVKVKGRVWNDFTSSYDDYYSNIFTITIEDNASGGGGETATPITISNISDITVKSGSTFDIVYTTNVEAVKHEMSLDGGYSYNTIYPNGDKNGYIYQHEALTESSSPYQRIIRVTDSNGYNATSNIIKITVSSDNTGGGTEPSPSYDITISPTSYTVEAGQDVKVKYTSTVDLSTCMLLYGPNYNDNNYSGGYISSPGEFTFYTSSKLVGTYTVKVKGRKWNDSTSSYEDYYSNEFTIIIEDNGSSGGGGGGSEQPTTPITIGNISDMAVTSGKIFNITYTTNVEAVKHEMSFDGGTTYHAIYPSGDKNGYIYEHEAITETSYPHQRKIRVTDANGNVATSNTFSITVSTSGGSGGNEGGGSGSSNDITISQSSYSVEAGVDVKVNYTSSIALSTCMLLYAPDYSESDGYSGGYISNPNEFTFYTSSKAPGTYTVKVKGRKFNNSTNSYDDYYSNTFTLIIGGSSSGGSGGTTTPITISNIDNMTVASGSTFNITYTTSVDATRHEMSFDGGSTFNVIYPTGDKNGYVYQHEGITETAYSHQRVIRVMDANGNTATSNTFSITVSSGGSSGGGGGTTPITINNISNMTVNSGSPFNIVYTTNVDAVRHEMSFDGGSSYNVIYPSGDKYGYTYQHEALTETSYPHQRKIRVTDANGNVATSNTFNITVSSGGSSGGGSGSTKSPFLASMYGDPRVIPNYPSGIQFPPINAHEDHIQPNGVNTTDSWKYGTRINLNPRNDWTRIGYWGQVYRQEGYGYDPDNVAVEIKDCKLWGWNGSSWVLIHDVSFTPYNTSFYVESFAGDSNKKFPSHVKINGKNVTIKFDSMNSGYMFHPYSGKARAGDYGLNQPYYYCSTMSARLVKWDSSGVDNLDSAKLCFNVGGDFWHTTHETWQPDWSANGEYAQGQFIKCTKEWRTAYCTNVPESWGNGFPTFPVSAMEARAFNLGAKAVSTVISNRFTIIVNRNNESNVGPNNPPTTVAPVKVKENLRVAKVNYDSKLTNLKNTITSIIDKTQITEADKTILNSAIDQYKTSVAELYKRFDESINNITENKSNEAQNNATAYSKAELEILADRIRSKVSNEELSSVIEQTNKDWTAIFKDGYNEGSTTINRHGVTVRNGALRVKNNSGTTVLEGDSDGNLSMRGSIETINDYGRLYLNGNSLKGFLNPSSTTPIYASGVWRPHNDSYQTGYVSVGNTNALIGDDNGCLYMSGDNNPNGTRAMLKYSRNSGNIFGAVEFTQHGGTSLVSSLNGGRDTYGVWNSAEGYVLPFKGNEYLGRNNRYWEAIYVRNTVSYNLNSVIDESKLLGEVQSETQRNKINTPTKKDFIECIKELDFGVYDSNDNINVRVLKTTNELTCKPIINTSLKLGVNNARNLLVKECTDREGENPIQTIDLTSYCSALAITLQDTIGKIESLEQENQELKDRLDKLENLVQSIVNK